MTTRIDSTEEWSDLRRLAELHRDFDLRSAFAGDPTRAERLTFETADLVVDLSKHLVNDEILSGLVDLALRAGLPERIEAMFTGAPLNTTERRAVMHVALRAEHDDSLALEGDSPIPQVHAVLDRMEDFAGRSPMW